MKRGKRLAVHAVNNFRAQFEDENHATCTWYMLLYAADGVAVLPTHPRIAHMLLEATSDK